MSPDRLPEDDVNDVTVPSSGSDSRPNGAFFLTQEAEERVQGLAGDFRTEFDITDLLDQEDAAPERGPVNVEAQEQAGQRIRIHQNDIRDGALRVMTYMEQQGAAELHARIDAERRPIFEQHSILLQAAQINIHDTDHQDRDGYIALRVGEAFPEKIDPKRLHAVVVASMIHDIAYLDAAMAHASKQINQLTNNMKKPTKDMLKLEGSMNRQRIKWAFFLRELERLSVDPETIRAHWEQPRAFPTAMKQHAGKIALDPHAPLGRKYIEELYENPNFAELFADWTDDMKMVAASAIENHSNGSTYNAYEVPIEAKLLRLADKLDNCNERTVGMLDETTLKDMSNAHRYAPSATTGMEIVVNKEKKEFRVRYFVDTSLVEDKMREFDDEFVYGESEHIAAFNKAYVKSMGLAAEVAHTLFAPQDELYAEDATFVVELAFVKTGNRHEQAYDRLCTNVTFA